MQGALHETRTSRWRARYARQSRASGQENMALCCDFLARRLSRHAGVQAAGCSCRRARTRRCCARHNAACCSTSGAPSAAYYYALLRRDGADSGRSSRQHRLASRPTILAPGRPMFEMIENQVYLAQGGLRQGDRAQRGAAGRAAKGCTMRSSRCTSASRPPWPMSALGKREDARSVARQMRCGTPSRTGW